MAKDTLFQIFGELIWFILGLCFYYLLSLIKVHLHRYLPMRIYNYQGSINQPFKHYLKIFIQDISSKFAINKYTFRYIFNYKKSEWGQPEIKQIKIVLNILEGFTTFLKPYIALAIIWALFKLWFKTHFLYDILKITLSEIQLFNNTLSKFAILNYLANNSAFVILGYSILCLLIPFLYSKDKTSSKLKRNFSIGLIYFSILINLSFFGSKAGEYISIRQSELRDIEFKIAKIHNEIFKTAATQIIIEDFKNDIGEYHDNLLHEQERLKIQEEGIDSSKISIVTSCGKAIVNLLRALEANLNAKFSIPSPPNSNPPNSPLPNLDPEYNKGFYKSSTNYFYNTNVNNTKEFKSDKPYFTNKREWNIESGQKVLSQLKQQNEKIVDIKNIQSKKIAGWIEALFDFGIDKSLQLIITHFGIENQVVIKEFLGIVLSENYKEPLSLRIGSYLTSLSKNIVYKRLSIPKSTFTIPRFFLSKVVNNEVNRSIVDFKKKRKDIIAKMEAEIKSRKEAERIMAKQQAEMEAIEKAEIKEQLKAERLIEAENADLAKKIKLKLMNVTFNPDLKDYESVGSLNSSRVDGHIRSQLITFMTDKGSKSNYAFNNYLKSNYEFLKINPNGNSILRNLSNGGLNTISSTMIGRCTCCGLPLAFPKCLCKPF